MKRMLLRLGIVAAIVTYTAISFAYLAGQHALYLSADEPIQHALRWDSKNPQLWQARARSLMVTPEAARPAEAVQVSLAAIRVSPLDPASWDLLAGAHQLGGDQEKMGAALKAGLAAMPHSPQAAWRYANYLILQGRVIEAAPHLRVVAAQAPSMRQAAYDVAYKLTGDVMGVFREVVPPAPAARADYLEFLIFRGKLAEAYPAWESLRGAGPLEIYEGNRYVEWLANAGLGAEAERVWEELLEDTGRRETKPAGDAITNGDFEASLTNTGMDWRVNREPGFDVDLDNFELRSGSRSLRVTFDGSQNVYFQGVSQLAAVEAGARYRFSAQMKTDSITTSNGVMLCISAVGPDADSGFRQCGPEVTGSEPWKRLQIDFTAPPHTRVVKIELRRLPSTKLNNRLAGRVWIDAVSLRKEG